MKMFKKLMAVALAGVMALVVLTGCANKALDTKEILASMKDTAGDRYILEDAGDADAAKMMSVLKEYKEKDAYKDMKVEDMLNDADVMTKVRENLVPADNKDMVRVSIAKVEEYQSKYYVETLYQRLARELFYNGVEVASVSGETGKNGKVSLKADQIGGDTYVVAVIRVAPKA